MRAVGLAEWRRDERMKATSLKDGPAVEAEAPPSATVSAGRGSVILAAAYVSVGAGNYLFTLVVARLLSLPEYGVVGLVQGFMLASAWLTQAGFPMTATRRLAASSHVEERAAVLRTCLVGNLVIAAALGGTLVILLATGALKLNGESAAPIFLAAAACSVMGTGQAARGALQGLFRFGSVAIAGMIETGLKLALGVGLTAAGLGPAGAVLGILVGLAVSTVYAMWMLRDIPKHQRQALGRRFKRYMTLAIVSDSLPMFVGFAGVAMLTTVDLFALKILDAPARSKVDAGLYSGAVIIARLPVFCAAAMAAAVFPYIARARNDIEASRLYVRKGVLYILALLTPFSLAMAVAPETVLRLFLKADFAAAAPALRILACGTILLSLCDFLLGAILAISARWLPSTLTALAVVFELVLLIVGINLATRHGTAVMLQVTALGFDCACAVSALVLWILALRRFKWRPRWRGAPAYVAASASFSAVAAVLPHEGFVSLVIACALGSVAYVIVVLLGGLLSRGDVSTLVAALPLRLVRRGVRV